MVIFISHKGMFVFVLCQERGEALLPSHKTLTGGAGKHAWKQAY